MRVGYCCKMAKAMISQHKNMELDLNLNRVGSEMTESLG